MGGVVFYAGHSANVRTGPGSNRCCPNEFIDEGCGRLSKNFLKNRGFYGKLSWRFCGGYDILKVKKEPDDRPFGGEGDVGRLEREEAT